MPGTYQYALVCLSILIAITSSFTAFDLASRVRASTGWARHAWLTSASVMLGGGIWGMHFVGMPAFSMPGVEVHYDPGLTLVSLLVPIMFTCVAFLAIQREGTEFSRLLPGGLLMGLGIGSMHYIGMFAMKMAAQITFDPFSGAVSFMIAIAVSIAALHLAMQTLGLVARVIAAIAMGVAISGMHYAAMEGAIFIVSPGIRMSSGGSNLDLAIAASTFFILFLGMIAAVYDRRRALISQCESQALRYSEERFRSLYSRTPLPLHSLDQDGRIEYVSESWIDLLGYRREEVIGRSLSNFMTQASAEQAISADWPRLFRDGDLIEAQYRMVTKAGVLLDVVASARLERNESGAVMHILGGLTNVTARRRAEAALHQSQKMEAIGQLTGGVAHDFNNLLAVVVGNLELLRKRVASDPRSVALVQNALTGAERGATLTQRMLAFARKQELKPEAVDLPELVRSMRELLQRSVGPTIRIETRFPLNLPNAYVDANQLELVLLNLAVNARDAMVGGGTISFEVSERKLSAKPDGAKEKYVCLSVRDTGVGMDAETLSRATEPFFTTKGIGKGTGLGLSMAQGLAEQSGGRLLLKSSVGKGTTVELCLPAAQAQQRAAKQRMDLLERDIQPRVSLAPLSILIVDDDPLVLSNTVAMLEDLGHTVFSASSSAAALRCLRSGKKVEMVITDQAMPGLTGTQLADIVHFEQPDMPILLVSGYVELPDGMHTKLLKLSKPFTQDALLQALYEAVNLKDKSKMLPVQLEVGQ